ncbi:MAG: MBL fold metallo-hydrolase [Geminicoccaceae bacterium]|nr:MBL fold metallo-hydrolase [Geminicoccaceae bacterium]
MVRIPQPVESGDFAREVVWAAPPPPLETPVPIAEGIFWLRFALPFKLDHINLWLLDDGDGFTLVDTGYGDARTTALWDALLADGHILGKPLARILATHFHPDHLGQAGRLCRRFDLPLLMTRTEWLTGRMLQLDTSEEFVAAGLAQDRRAGLDPELVARRRDRGNAYRPGVTPVPASIEILEAGDELVSAGTRWKVVVGRGHSPEMVTLYSAERRILVAGDQLLPRITPVVGLWPTSPERNPLGVFVESLARYEGLPEDVLVLPSHERPYRGLAVRLAQLRAHHRARLDETEALCREPATAAEVMARLFPKELDLHQIGFALAETLAHLVALEHEGRIVRRRRPDGVEIWQVRARC